MSKCVSLTRNAWHLVGMYMYGATVVEGTMLLFNPWTLGFFTSLYNKHGVWTSAILPGVDMRELPALDEYGYESLGTIYKNFLLVLSYIFRSNYHVNKSTHLRRCQAYDKQLLCHRNAVGYSVTTNAWQRSWWTVVMIMIMIMIR